ncbi:hypothetical protein [Paraburkholderia sediminicola]|uniref:hypothetical protein n=1 Tax=Paraburkholderia sediminicola TaxID=458836 RepID=UPI0038BA6D3F
MNHTEQAYLAPAQCNQLQFDDKNDGAMFASAEVIARAKASLTKPRKTPRKIPGVAKSEKRGFIVSDRKLVGGSFFACAMLGDLRYWLEPDETGKVRAKIQADGHYWVARSRQHWMKLFDASEQEVKTALKHLVGDAVVCQTMEFGNWATDHYRINFEVAGYKLCGGDAKGVSSNQVSSDHEIQKGVSSNPTLVSSNHTPVSINLATSGSTQGSNQDVKTLGAASPAPTPAHLNPGQGEAKGSETPKATPAPDPTPDKSPWSKSGRLTTEYVGLLEAIWRKGSKKYVSSLGKDQRGKLRNFGEKLLRADLDPLRALETLVTSPDAWSRYATRLNGVYKAYPSLMILGTTAHIDTLINLILENKAKQAAKSAAQQAPAPKPIPKAVPATTKPLEAIDELLAKWKPKEFVNIPKADWQRLVDAGVV